MGADRAGTERRSTIETSLGCIVVGAFGARLDNGDTDERMALGNRPDVGLLIDCSCSVGSLMGYIQRYSDRLRQSDASSGFWIARRKPWNTCNWLLTILA
jgi:hypothetical protein